MSDHYEDRYVLDDYDTPSFYGKSADKYFGDIDRENKENRRAGVTDATTLYEPTNYLKNRGMSRQEMEYYAGAAGIRNVSGQDDLEAVYKAYVDDKAGGRNKESIDSLRDDFNEFKNQQPKETSVEKAPEPYEPSPQMVAAKERVNAYKKSKLGDFLLGTKESEQLQGNSITEGMGEKHAGNQRDDLEDSMPIVDGTTDGTNNSFDITKGDDPDNPERRQLYFS